MFVPSDEDEMFMKSIMACNVYSTYDYWKTVMVGRSSIRKEVMAIGIIRTQRDGNS